MQPPVAVSASASSSIDQIPHVGDDAHRSNRPQFAQSTCGGALFSLHHAPPLERSSTCHAAGSRCFSSSSRRCLRAVDASVRALRSSAGSLSIRRANSSAPARRRPRMWRDPLAVMATRTTLLSVASVSRSTNSDRSNPLTRAVIEGWVTPSTVARSVIRRGPDRSNVASVDKAVRLISRGVRAIADAESPRRISPIAIGPRALDGPFVAARFGLIPISIGHLYCLSISFAYLFRSWDGVFCRAGRPGRTGRGTSPPPRRSSVRLAELFDHWSRSGEKSDPASPP